MKKVKPLFAVLLLATSIMANAQKGNQKLIAVVNSANWCMVCKANVERFGTNLTPYATKGVTILTNDLTNDTTIAAFDKALKNAGVYKAVYFVKRKSMGKMLQSCRLVKGKTSKSLPSGTVTFINPVTHKQLKQVSIEISDEAMKAAIDNLLK